MESSAKKKSKSKKGFCETPAVNYTGVRKRKSGRWQAVIRNPFKNSLITLGTYDTPEEASKAVSAKKLEFKQQLNASSCNGSPSLQSLKVVKKKVPTKCLLLGQSDAEYGDKDGTKYPEEIERVLGKIPSIKRYKCVWRRKSGVWVCRIRDPITNVRVWVGIFETDEEACNAYYRKKIEFETQVLLTATEKPENPPIVANASQQESSNSAFEIQDSNLDLPNESTSTMNCNPMEATDEKVMAVTEKPENPQIVANESQQESSNTAIEIQDSALDLPDNSTSTMNCNPMEAADEKVHNEGLLLGQFWLGSIIDNHGFLLGEFSCVDDLRICKD